MISKFIIIDVIDFRNFLKNLNTCKQYIISVLFLYLSELISSPKNAA